jgi:hypothetical protein
MNERLQAALNDEVQLIDEEAGILFFELGFIDKFKRPVSSEITRQVIFFTQHLTHWIIAICHSGNSDPSKARFEAMCFPKIKVTLLTFQTLAVKLLDPAPEVARPREDAVISPTEAQSETLPLFRD